MYWDGKESAAFLADVNLRWDLKDYKIYSQSRIGSEATKKGRQNQN